MLLKHKMSAGIRHTENMDHWLRGALGGPEKGWADQANGLRRAWREEGGT